MVLRWQAGPHAAAIQLLGLGELLLLLLVAAVTAQRL